MIPKQQAPKRLSAKFFLDSSTPIDAADLVPVFHDWIGRQAVEEMLIDVVEYGHVGHGPSLMLVALEADYVLDTVEGRPGIRYIRKRGIPGSLTAALALTIAQAAQACQLIATSSLLESPPSFDLSAIEIEILDKLNYPDLTTHVAELEQAVFAVGKEVFAQENLTLERIAGDARRPLRLVLRGVTSSLADILSRLRNGHHLQQVLAEETAG